MSLLRLFTLCAFGLGAMACDSDEGAAVVDPDPFCANRPALETFCEDFDAKALPGTFGEQRVSGSGRLSLEREDQDYVAYELQAQTEGPGVAQLVKVFPEEGYKFRIFGFIHIQTPVGEAGESELFGTEMRQESGAVQRVGFRLRADGTGYVYSEIGDAVETFEVTKPLLFDEWQSFRFDFETLNANAAKLHLRFGSPDFFLSEDIKHAGEYGFGTMKIGLVSEGSASFTTRYDDLTFEIN